jgi:hypothetical protein
MAPLATAALESNTQLGAAVICTGEAQQSSPDGTGKAPHSPQHHHCILCQSCFGGTPLPLEHLSVAFSTRIANLLRLRIAAASRIASRESHDGQPRGPPSLI